MSGFVPMWIDSLIFTLAGSIVAHWLTGEDILVTASRVYTGLPFAKYPNLNPNRVKRGWKHSLRRNFNWCVNITVANYRPVGLT